MEQKSLCRWGISMLHCADSGEGTQAKHFRWRTWHQSRSPTLTLPILNTSLTDIFTLTNFLTDNWTVNFPHHVCQISRPKILIEFPHVNEAFVVTVWHISLSTISLLLTVGNWNLRCRQKYDVIYRDTRSTVSTYEDNKHTDNISRITTVLLGWKAECNIEFYVAVLFVFPCVSVCSIYIFETCEQWLQIWCEHYDDIVGHHGAWGCNCRHFVIRK